MVAFSPLEESVLAEIRPRDDEKNHIRTVARSLVDAINETGLATGMIVGSVARDTWIRGDRDLDIFLLFPASLSREELQAVGLDLARKVADAAGGVSREKYAEHPYIHASLEGLDVDLVPCYDVPDPSAIQSAVDRTPFHTRYIKDHIFPYIDDVLLLKQFTKSGGIYGSDQMTEGFSGYLCELLILHYRGFHSLVRAAADWKPGFMVDIQDHRGKTFHEPMVVIDPVDPGRNVAAAVSLSRMCEFIELCRGYLEKPGPAFFSPAQPGRYTCEEFGSAIRERNTAFYSVVFQTPPYIEEIVVPQLRKSMHAVVALLSRHEFVVNRASYCMHPEKCMVLFELLVDSLPPVQRHFGPPVWSRENSTRFLSKYQEGREKGEVFSGPYIENGIYVVEVPRRYHVAGELLSSPELMEIGLGRHVRSAMGESREIRHGAGCWDEEFSEFLTEFLSQVSPLTSTRSRMAPGRNQ